MLGDAPSAYLYFAEAHRLRPSRPTRVGVRAHRTPLPEAIVHARGGRVWRIAFDPAGERLAVGTDSGDVVLYDARSLTETARFRHAREPVRGLAFLPDGRQLVTGDETGCLRLIDLPEGHVLRSVEAASPDPRSGAPKHAIFVVAPGPEAWQVAAACQDVWMGGARGETLTFARA